MNRVWAYRLVKAVFFNVILMELVCLAALWIAAPASYGGNDILDEVATRLIGYEVKPTLFAGGKEQTRIVGAGNLGETIRNQAPSVRGRLGVDVRPVTSKEVQQYGLNSQQGVVLIQVDSDSPLAGIGFEVNDMILEINGQAINGLEVFVDLVSALKPQQRITLLGLDHRSGRTGYILLVVP